MSVTLWDKKIKIGGLCIESGEPVFIIAEAVINHNGDVVLAKRLSDAKMISQVRF